MCLVIIDTKARTVNALFNILLFSAYRPMLLTDRSLRQTAEIKSDIRAAKTLKPSFLFVSFYFLLTLPEYYTCWTKSIQLHCSNNNDTDRKDIIKT